MTFGIQTINSNNVIGIDSSEVAVRYIGSIKLDYNFSGNISIPRFDIDRGTYFLSPYMFKYAFDISVRVADTTPMGNNYVNLINQFGTTADRFTSPQPILSWNNTTKLMSVTPVTGAKGDYKLTLLHYK
jgi:hypothetical protein